MNELLDPALWQSWLNDVLIWARAEILTVSAAAQFVILALAWAVSGWVGRRLTKASQHLVERWPPYGRVTWILHPLLQPIAALLILRLGVLILGNIEATGIKLLVIASSLLTAWIVVRLASNLVRNPVFAKAFATIAWSIAALNILGFLDPLVAALQGFGFTIGGATITAYGVITGIITAVLLIWGAQFLASVSEQSLKRVDSLNPSLQVLFSKVVRIALLAVAVLIALSSAGIDLTALAVFSGALGVGLGFGLQKVVSNFISGIILLMDRSIKPGDVIETQGTYGWINKLAARYTSVVTRDGTEYLIPNEDMITQPVINWSHSDRNVRRRIPVQVAYSSDVKKAMALMEEAAGNVSRILKSPAPRTLMRGFGSDGVDLELRFWIDDPFNGVSNVASEVMLGIWDLFHENGIEFPFPQRDLHITKDSVERLRGLFPRGEAD